MGCGYFPKAEDLPHNNEAALVRQKPPGSMSPECGFILNVEALKLSDEHLKGTDDTSDRGKEVHYLSLEFCSTSGHQMERSAKRSLLSPPPFVDLALKKKKNKKY